jgi:DNA-binding transcriptional MocR family regulator
MTAGPRIKPDEEVFLDITIDRSSDEPIYRQLVRRIQELIHSGALPEGFRLPPERRLAAALDVNRSTVLNAYRELKALDEHDLVIYLSTFSKMLLPGLRIGYMVVPPVVLRQLVLAKQGADLHSNSFGQFLLERFIRKGHLATHIDGLKRAYRRRRDMMAAALTGETETSLDVRVPAGGSTSGVGSLTTSTSRRSWPPPANAA